MRVGIAQINTVARDFPGNARRLLHGYRECLDLGAEWVVTPALALSGFEAQARDGVACLQALDYLSTEIGPVPLIVGHGGPDGLSTASLLQGGEVRVAFRERGSLEGNGVRIGVEATGWEGGWEADCDAVFHLGLEPFIDRSPAVAFCGYTPRVFCNAIGGQGERIYAGRSAAFAHDGGCLSMLDAFVEVCRVVDLSRPGSGGALESHDLAGLAGLAEALTLAIRDRVRKGGYLGAVLGLDGSLESEVLACLGRRAVGEEALHGFTFAENVTAPHASSKAVRRVDTAGMLDSMAQALAPFSAQADPAEVNAMMLSAISDREGCLLLNAATLTQRLTEGKPRRGFAPLGDLPGSRVEDLARLLGCTGTVAIDASAEAIIRRFAINGSAMEELQAEGFSEAEILRWQRRVKRSLGKEVGDASDILKVS